MYGVGKVAWGWVGGGVIQHDCKIHRVHISTFDML